MARLVALGAVIGVAWAAGLRSYMWQISPAPHVDWIGTFAAILLPGAVCGALLGAAEGRRRAARARGLRWFALAPIAFPVAALSLPGALWTFVTTGIGGGALGVALLAIGGGFALSGTGRMWARAVAGALALVILGGVVASVPGIGGVPLALTEPRGAWVAVLVGSLLALIAVATSIPFRAPAADRIVAPR